MKIQIVSHEARTRQDLHSVLTSGFLALINKRERSQKLAVEQDRRELQLLEETVWPVQTWEMQALCLVTSSDLFLFCGRRKLERLLIFPWGRFNQKFSSGRGTKAAKSSFLPLYLFFQQAEVPGGNNRWIEPEFPWISISASRELRAVKKSQKVAQQLSGWLPSFILSCGMHRFWLNGSLEETFFVWRTDWDELWKWQDCRELKKPSVSLLECFPVFPFSPNCRLLWTLSLGVICLQFPLCAHAINKHCFYSESESWWVSMHATENNLRKPICIWKQDFNCIFQSRC